MTELRTQLEAARVAHQQVAYPGDLAADLLAPEDAPRPILLRLFYGAGALAAAAAVTFGVLRVGGAMGTDPADWRRQLADLGDRGRALVASVSSGLPSPWELPDLRLPQMGRPSEFPQHLRMMSPLNRVPKPELPEKMLPGEDAPPARGATHAA
jgi:hypothetical protein